MSTQSYDTMSKDDLARSLYDNWESNIKQPLSSGQTPDRQSVNEFDQQITAFFNRTGVSVTTHS